MKGISLLKISEKWRIREISIPKLSSPSDILIKVKYAPINPADIYFSYGVYGIKPIPPFTPGMEGSGIIEKVGEKISKDLIGKKCAFLVNNESIGSFAEYTISSLQNTIILNDNDELDKFSNMFVNPFTAVGFLNIIKKNYDCPIIQTASFSAVGQMVIKLLKKNNVKTINIIRKENQINQLINIGADYVLNSEKENFIKKLNSVIEEIKPKILFDAIGGSIIGDIFNLMPCNSVCYSYGALSHKQFSNIEASNFVFQNKEIKGFWLKRFMNSINEKEINDIKDYIYKEKNLFTNKINKILDIENVNDALKEYKINMSGGKILLKI